MSSFHLQEPLFTVARSELVERPLGVLSRTHLTHPRSVTRPARSVFRPLTPRNPLAAGIASGKQHVHQAFAIEVSDNRDFSRTKLSLMLCVYDVFPRAGSPSHGGGCYG